MTTTVFTTKLPLDDLRTLIPDWQTSLKARNCAPQTIRSYSRSVIDMINYLVHVGMPTTVTGIRREHVESFLAAEQDRVSAATVGKHYRCLLQLFRWLEEEGEITASPMAKMRPPRVPEQPVPVLTDDEIKRLLDHCKGTDFTARRDTAIIRCLMDTGCRREELATLTVDDIDWDRQTLTVMGKGRRRREVPFGAKTANSLRQYLRARARHQWADRSDRLWLGRHGPVQPDGFNQIMHRLGKVTGIKDLHPHRFRHTFAHHWLLNGGQEVDLRRLAGWKSPQMVARYGASAADERAREAHRKAALGDRL